jgi:nucleoside-diphosphate-sugar epimerase
MKTAFVTGGTGFLGYNLIDELLSDGVEVTALHRKSSDVSRLQRSGVKLAVGTITDKAEVLAAMPKDLDAVFHVAGNTSWWSGGNDAQTRDNVDGTRNMVEAAKERGAKCFIQTSSISAYSAQPPPTWDETARSTALESKVNYERTKFLGEEEVKKAAKEGLRAVIMNPGNIVGRYDTANWSRMILMIHKGTLPGVPPGKGSFCDATQVARAHIAAVTKGKTGENYILAGTDASMVEFVRIIGARLGRKVPDKAAPVAVLAAIAWAKQLASTFTKREPDITPELVSLFARPPSFPSSKKAEEELGYKCLPLETMVDTACAWLEKEGLLS